MEVGAVRDEPDDESFSVFRLQHLLKFGRNPPPHDVWELRNWSLWTVDHRYSVTGDLVFQQNKLSRNSIASRNHTASATSNRIFSFPLARDERRSAQVSVQSLQS